MELMTTTMVQEHSQHAYDRGDYKQSPHLHFGLDLEMASKHGIKQELLYDSPPPSDMAVHGHGTSKSALLCGSRSRVIRGLENGERRSIFTAMVFLFFASSASAEYSKERCEKPRTPADSSAFIPFSSCLIASTDGAISCQKLGELVLPRLSLRQYSAWLG